jgi:hypothetical protein
VSYHTEQLTDALEALVEQTVSQMDLDDEIEREVEEYLGGEQFARQLEEAVEETVNTELQDRPTNDDVETAIGEATTPLAEQLDGMNTAFEGIQEAFEFAAKLQTAGFRQRLRWLLTGKI